MSNDFQTFHSQNPQVYEEFKRVAFEAIGKGFRKLSADFLLHVLRWQSGKDWKLNNNFTAYYARLFVSEHQAYAGFFELRRSEYINARYFSDFARDAEWFMKL